MCIIVYAGVAVIGVLACPCTCEPVYVQEYMVYRQNQYHEVWLNSDSCVEGRGGGKSVAYVKISVVAVVFRPAYLRTLAFPLIPPGFLGKSIATATADGVAKIVVKTSPLPQFRLSLFSSFFLPHASSFFSRQPSIIVLYQ